MTILSFLDSVASAIVVLDGRLEAMERRRAHGRVSVRADASEAHVDAAAWREEQHPRAEDGKFGSGGGSAKPANENTKGAGPSDKPAGPGAEKRPSSRTPIPGVQLMSPAGPKKGEAGHAPGSLVGTKGVSEHGVVAPEHFSANHFAHSHDDAKASAASVLGHFSPDVRRQVAHYIQKAMRATPTTETYKKEGQYEAKRKALHQQIMFTGWTDKAGKKHPGVLSPERIKAATPAPGETPTFTLLGGRGGSGKSSFGKPGPAKVYDEDRAILLDADEVKKALPEYEGWNANQVHEESGDVFDEITRLAKEMGLNIVQDATLKTPAKAVDQVKEMKALGYKVEAHYMHLPRQEAAKRAVERALNSAGTKVEGRLVPPEVVLSNVKNEASFDGIKDLADGWSFWDNNVSRGEPPRLISRKAG